ncbi:MAG TPA: YpdA family putative bacillithiol disulfide reductase [Longimicrobiales bacterium]|nr:YpdA family putative bacillithiol disulfide reductase [Longimicrobiales bacterium]
MAQPFDLAVVGAGPCGIATGIAAHAAGLTCVLFDKGCVVSSISGYPTWMKFFSTADRLEIGGVPFVVTGDKPTRREALRYYQRLAREFELDVRQYEAVESVKRTRSRASAATSPQDGLFELATRTTVGVPHIYTAHNVVVATGYFDSPNLLGIPGEDLPKVAHSYREGHEFYDQEVIVVGGGNSAVDAALELHHWGARVTLVHFADGLDPNVKPWVRPEIEARLREGDIQSRFASRLIEVRPETALIEHAASGAVEEVPNDWVLAMTGYMPDGALLRALGVSYDPESGIPHHDPDSMETNVTGVFIAGVLSAGFNANKVFIENGRGHGELIAARVAAKQRPPLD